MDACIQCLEPLGLNDTATYFSCSHELTKPWKANVQKLNLLLIYLAGRVVVEWCRVPHVFGRGEEDFSPSWVAKEQEVLLEECPGTVIVLFSGKKWEKESPKREASL